MFTGPWKAGRGAGRWRRGESVIIGLKNRVHVQIFGYPTPVVQNGAERANPTVKAGQMSPNMGFLKGSKTPLLGTKIIGLFDIKAVCGIL